MKKINIDLKNAVLVSFALILAAMYKALVDTIAFHGGGVFKGKDFFNINKQGKMLPHTTYPLDGFHLANSAMILCFILAVIFYKQSAAGFKEKLILLFIFGVIYIGAFNIF